AMGPASDSPAAMRGMESRCAASAVRLASSSPGASACRRRVSSVTRAARKPRSRQNTITPVLMNSPRSTLGTTRTTADSNVLRAGTTGLLHKPLRALQPSRQILNIGRALHIGRACTGQREPLTGHEGHDGLQRLAIE